MEKITLKHPIMIDGVQRAEFDYSAENITGEMFLEACSLAAKKDPVTPSAIKMKENDIALHFYLGIMAICAAEPEIDAKDLERVKGTDILAITDIGMLFIMRVSEEDSEQNTSEERSEIMPEPITPEQERSESGD